MVDFSLYQSCKCCPHECGVNRNEGELGFCKLDSNPSVSSIFLHKGEEPIISGNKGICNVFFTHCNLQCIYCQNYQISRNDSDIKQCYTNTEEIVREISLMLENGINHVGFVSPSHQIIQMMQVVNELHKRNLRPIVVYNSNGYDKVETLKRLDGVVDVFLPDFKYYDNELAHKYSGVNDYLEIATNALKEMYRQKGSTVLLDENNLIESGIIIRHLVLPGNSSDSINILDHIAEEISPFMHISLMSQYYPTPDALIHNGLDRVLYSSEYFLVVNKMEAIGFKGWIQDISSTNSYQPDFDREKPFLD